MAVVCFNKCGQVGGVACVVREPDGPWIHLHPQTQESMAPPGSEHLVVGKEGFPGGERTWESPRGWGPGHPHSSPPPFLPCLFPLLGSISNSLELGHSSLSWGPPCSPWGAFCHPSSDSWPHRILGCRARAGLQREQGPGVMGFVVRLLLPHPLWVPLELDVGSPRGSLVAGSGQRKAGAGLRTGLGGQVSAVLRYRGSISQHRSVLDSGRGPWGV